MTVLSSVCNLFNYRMFITRNFSNQFEMSIEYPMGDIQSQWPSISRKRGFFGIKERKQVITREKRSYVLAIRTSPIPSGRRTSCRSPVFLGQLCLIDCNVPLPSYSSFFDSRSSFSFFYYQPLSPPCHPAFLSPFRKLGITYIELFATKKRVIRDTFRFDTSEIALIDSADYAIEWYD